jgi:hypothetical protein
MSIADDWSINYSAKTISHIDGILSYDGGGAGAQAAVGDYVRGATSGALGKVLARSGNATTGTYTLTNVLGLFVNDENLAVLSYVDFDNVGNGGFPVGVTIVEQVTGTMQVKFIEYNIDGVAGHGRAFGIVMSVFTNNSQIDISGGQTAVALADGVGVDNDTLCAEVVNGTLAPPGTTNTNKSIIVHYDTGTIAVPEDAHLRSGASGATGYAQRVYGAVAAGSIRIVDSDTTGGGWNNNDAVRILDCVYYDTLVAGKVFSVNDVVKAVNGTSPTAAGRVIKVIEDTGSTGKLVLANFSGTWSDDNEIHVKQPDDTYVKYGEVANGTNRYLDAALLNLPSGVRTTQRADQGGILGNSLNIIRSCNAFYTYIQEMYVALAQLDDLPPLSGDVKDQLYTVLNSYIIPDLSFRFLEKGSFKDSGNNNIFTNIQSAGAIADISNTAYYYSAVTPCPMPDLYIEQNGAVIRQDWLEGPLDVLLKVKTSTSPTYINPAVNALGQLINGGAYTLHVRPYTRTYDSVAASQVGGIAVMALGNAVDGNNRTGQYRTAYTSGTGMPFLVGEEAMTASGKRIQITASGSGATGNVDYVLKSSTNLVGTDVFVGIVSGATATAGAPSNLVAGYGTDIRAMTVSRRFLGGTTTGTYLTGELITQTGTGATGYFMEDDGGTIYVEDVAGTFSGTGSLTGAVSGATNTPTSTAAYTTVPKDIGGGVGDKNYTAVISANVTNANARTVQEVYEWMKFLTRAESAALQGGPGATAGVMGKIYRRLSDTYAEVRGASPYGSKPGAVFIGAQGVFVEKFTLAAADLRNIQLKDNLGDIYDPPNLQLLQATNITAGVRAAIYRSTGAGLETILRTEFKVGTVGGGNNQSANSTILVAANTRTVSPLPNDVPDSGVLRILDPAGTGNYLRFVYASVNRTTNVFTLTQGIGQNTIGAVTGSLDLVLNYNAHVVLIEQEASGTSVTNTIQYVADIPLYVVARVKGKQPFKTTSSFTSAGASVGVVLNPDNVVNLP